MGKYSRFRQVRPAVIVDPSQEEVELTAHTSKIFPLVATPGSERFPIVIEDESVFYRKRLDGKIERVVKVAGKGFAGGGAMQKETPIETAIREGNEELGTPAAALRARIRPDIVHTSYAEPDMYPFHVFYVAVAEEDINRCLVEDGKVYPFVNRAAITDPKLSGRKVEWVRLSEFRRAVLPPGNADEREEAEEAGARWFYFRHTISLVALLLKMAEKGILKGPQANLAAIVYKQLAPPHALSALMIAMLKELDATPLLKTKLARAARHTNSAHRAIENLVFAGLPAFAEEVVKNAEGKVKKSARDSLARYLKMTSPDSEEVFESVEDMLAFHSQTPWDDPNPIFAEGDDEEE